MRTLLRLVLGLSMSFPFASRASQASFSEDGKTLWVLSFDHKALLAFDGKAPAPVSFPLPVALAGEQTMDLISDHDGLLITAADKLWKWNPLAGGTAPKAIAPLPPEFYSCGLGRVPEGPLAGAILINGRSGDPRHPETLHALLPGENQFRSVNTRYIHQVTAAPAFAPGRMVLGGDYDLWEGGFTPMGDGERQLGYLWGYRTAPVAQLSTDIGNGEGQGVRTVVIAGDTLWTLIAGHHNGCSLLTLPIGKKFTAADPESTPGVSQSLKISRDKLAQVKIMNVSDKVDRHGFEFIDCLCAWHGGNGEWKVAYRAGHRVLWQVANGHETPKKIGDDPSEN